MRERLEMTTENESKLTASISNDLKKQTIKYKSLLFSDGYFSPLSTNIAEKRIIIESGILSEPNKSVIRTLFSNDKLEEISENDLAIIKSQMKFATRKTAPSLSSIKSDCADSNASNILIYPSTGKGGIEVKANDYICLASDQYLNDVIIDFYLKYLLNQVLTVDQQAKTHIFSSFFYNTLTNTKHMGSSNKDVTLTAAQKRHERVKKWTKNVNIFEKDYIVVPINQQSHWFLAIICFLPLKGPVSMESNQPVKPIAITARKKAPPAPTSTTPATATPSTAATPTAERKPAMLIQIGNTTITPVSKKEFDSICLDEESERDEAEGDESDLDTEDEQEPVEPPPSNQAIKQCVYFTISQFSNFPIFVCRMMIVINLFSLFSIHRPCILIFDSLAGASRNRVVATLRDYLTCEYRTKIKLPADHQYDKTNLPGSTVKVPQQTNFTDCGLYLLQYVEHFFTVRIRFDQCY